MKKSGRKGNHIEHLPTSSDILNPNDLFKLPELKDLGIKLIEKKNNAASVTKLVQDERIYRNQLFLSTASEGEMHTINKEKKQKMIAKKKLEASTAFRSERLGLHYIQVLADL